MKKEFFCGANVCTSQMDLTSPINCDYNINMKNNEVKKMNELS